jgi:diguanylate cyclase (GGDEF)-like protein/PAS domain S-box-containing protein
VAAVSAFDAQQRRSLEKALRESEALHRSIVETAQEGIWLMDDTGRTLFANSSLAEILGRSPEQIKQLRVFDIVDPDAQAEAGRRRRSRRYAGHEVYEIRFVRGDGDRRWASVSASPLTIKDEYVGSLLMVSDITERKRTEAELERRAMYDDLTGLPNRTLLHDRLRHLMGRREAPHFVGVFFIDLDDFKEVNDSYGHAAGDEALREVADRLRTVVGDDDTLARYAGDEFVIVVPDLVGELEANALAERVFDVLKRPLAVSGHAVVVNASIGVSLQMPPGDGEQLILDADVAMFQAKSRGRGRHVMFDAQVARQSRHHLEDVQELRAGMEHNELEVFYQPQVEMSTGVVGSVEALVRWRHPSRGLLQPEEFIELAEASGLILSLGRRVLEAACQQAAEWARTLPEPLSVAVNVSACQLDDETFPETVRDALFSSDLAPELLVLEITESAVMSDTDRALRVLRELRLQGVHLAIDDFGTGYSSLAHLKRLPVEEIKIDREFVDRVDQGGDDHSIVGAVVSMAKALDLRVVAEGVETKEQAEALQDLGCTVAQGYLYGRPVDGGELSASLGQV